MLFIDSSKRPQFLDKVIQDVQKAIDELEKKEKENIDLESTVISDVGYTASILNLMQSPVNNDAKVEEEQLEKLSQYSQIGVLGICIKAIGFVPYS